MKTWTGIGVSEGIVSGPLWLYRPTHYEVPRRAGCDPKAEWQRVLTALEQVKQHIAALRERAGQSVGEAEAAIFDAHRMFLEDPELLEDIQRRLQEEGINAEAAVQDAGQNFSQMMLALEDAYFRERAQDVQDVIQQVIRALLGLSQSKQSPLQPAIILAEELTPSDTIQFERSVILGLATMRGGPTSHAAILARSLGVPAAVSVPFELADLRNGQPAVLDGNHGTLTVDPDPSTLAAAEQSGALYQARQKALLESAQAPTMTRDGMRVEVVANIGSAEDAVQAVHSGAEGVGLFRTEFLYMGQNALLSEEQQIAAYREVFRILAPRPVVVRTLDIGGDKDIPYLGLQREQNPFLGWRGIRMISERPDLLSGQFRALLQAGVEVDLRIMIPMVSSLREVIQARELFEQTRRELMRQGLPCAEKVQFGIMVEVPSIALVAEHAAHLVDFFSIGTNDLTQYTLAVDRGNERVASLASPFHPAVLQLIAKTVRAAHSAGKWCGLCGEMAGDPLAAPFLLGIGLDEFSASPALIPALKETLRNLDTSQCRPIAERCLTLSSPEEVQEHLRKIAGTCVLPETC